MSWRSPITIVSLCSTLPLVLAFLWVETRFALEPFTPGHVIFDKALCACYVQNFFGYASFTAFIFYIPFFFQVVLEMTPAQAGAGLIPAAVSAVVGTLLGGIIIKRIGEFYWLALIASTVGTATSVLLAVAPSLRHVSNIVVYAASVATFVPQGITITASLIAISRPPTTLYRPPLTYFSIERFSSRSSSRHGMLVPVPLSWCCSRRLAGWTGNPTSPGHEASSEIRPRSSRTDPQESGKKFGFHQGFTTGSSQCSRRML